MCNSTKISYIVDAMRSLFVFLDESGNFDFSPSGTSHFVMTAAITEDPLKSSAALQSLKYHFLEQGSDIEWFHAAPDRQAVRDQVFTAISALNGIRYHHIHIEKRKASATVQTASAIYALCGETLLRGILRDSIPEDVDQVIIIFDKALTRKDQEAFLKSVKPSLKSSGISYQIYFHRTMTDFNGQIADYGAWAKYVSLTRAEMRPLVSLASIPQSDFNLLEPTVAN